MLKHKLLRACVLLCLALNIQQGKAQETNELEYGEAIQGVNQDPKQKSIGSKPYEMEGRREAREPLLLLMIVRSGRFGQINPKLHYIELKNNG